MNTKKTIAVLAIAMAVAFVATVGMASAEVLETKTLWAGQNIDAGTVTVSNDGTYINITYAEITDGWELTAYHVYVSTVEAPTKSAPGKFQYKGDVDPADTPITVQTIDSPDCDETIHIAAHAELQKYLYTTEEGVEIYQYESGWASGGDTDDVRISPGKNWATYFEVTIPCEP